MVSVGLLFGGGIVSALAYLNLANAYDPSPIALFFFAAGLVAAQIGTIGLGIMAGHSDLATREMNNPALSASETPQRPADSAGAQGR